MKIVNRATFLSLPPGTVFSKYAPCWFGDLCIKDETTPYNDFWYVSIPNSLDVGGTEGFVDRLTESEKTSASIPMDFEDVSRDGMQGDVDQLFAVWEARDVAALIVRLQQALKDASA